jgi:hypothetical protein
VSKLEFGPKGFFNRRRYSVEHNGLPVAEIACTIIGAKATITIGGESYRAAREGVMSGAFYLEANGSRIASAEKPNLFHRLFAVRCGTRAFTLKSAAAFGRAYVLTENEAAIGTITRQGFFGRKFSPELPDDLTLEFKLFLIWLVIVLWRRQRRAGAAAATAGAVAAGAGAR